ncbi:ATP-dependent helicase HrpB [Nocardioides kribbensis]|uniref:ATP-dependent helicase HrpB n=1 Tax=Nocardioides kribbensis TaxID=305517 RepID=UPI0032DB8914
MSDPIRRLLAHPPDLPVVAGLPALRVALEDHGAAVVQAPPGTGKTTLVPPLVADLLGGGGGRVVVTQPRRIAARAAARRLAHLLGEPVGETVGYTVRGERRAGPATRVEVVTTGVLLRRLQRDPDLPGVGAVVLDEVHERHLDGDLTLALLVDVRQNLREDLLLVAMSATVEATRTAALLGPEAHHPTDASDGTGAVPSHHDPGDDSGVSDSSDGDDGGATSDEGAPRGAGAGSPGAVSTAVPVVDVPGALHPVQRRWCPPPPAVRRADDRGVTPAFLDHVAATTRVALAEHPGDVLVFLPGVAEVDGVVRRLAAAAAAAGVDVRPLHGRLPAVEQDRALSPGERRRVVVSTAVAESSLTVPGVRVVVDAGLSREPRTDHARGLAGLVTVRVSRAAAEQRAGRAGREAAGAVLRCWSEAEHAHLEAHPQPEILTADLTALALELAVWGVPDGAGLALLDPPPPGPLALARATLAGLGAVDDAGAVTARGRAIAGVPADPRLARALLDGAAAVGARRAAEVVALLADDVRVPGGDLVAALRAVRRGGPASAAWRTTAERLRASLPADHGGGAAAPAMTDDLAVGAVVALAHPDRIARKRAGSEAYVMVGGTGAVLGRGESALRGLEWLAVAGVDRRSGQRDATVRSAAPLDEDLALEAAAPVWREEDDVRWEQGRVRARRVTRLGAVELASSTLARPPAELVAAAVRDGLRRDGLAALPWSEAAHALRRRLAFLRTAVGEPWPDVSDAALLESAESWLGPELARVRTARDLARVDVLGALRRLLPWPQAGRLDELAPERLTVPSGSAVRLDYEGDQPVLAVRVQEAFGWAETPRVADGRVPVLVHLLSPARRPVAVTADLASFWATGYPAVRAELRGRYPKHAWPDDPWTAPATRGTGRRR